MFVLLAACEVLLSPRLAPGVLRRKRHPANQVAAAAEQSIDQIVVLSAGLDTRAHRVSGTTRVFEVDLPANIATKHARVERSAPFPDMSALYQWISRPTTSPTASPRPRSNPPAVVVVWEADTQCLIEAAIRDTFTSLANATPAAA